MQSPRDSDGGGDPGTVQADGTGFAGISPDGNAPMFTTRCDAGQTWNCTTCTGSSLSFSWNNGNTSGYTDTLALNTATGAANTETIVAADSDSDAGGTQPHFAAQYCDQLDENGHADWYLPAQNELLVIYNGKAATGNFNSGGRYWSSTQAGTNGAREQVFSDGSQQSTVKHGAFLVRCVRKGNLEVCSSPTGREGALHYNGDNSVLQYCDGKNWRAIGKIRL